MRYDNTIAGPVTTKRFHGTWGLVVVGIIGLNYIPEYSSRNHRSHRSRPCAERRGLQGHSAPSLQRRRTKESDRADIQDVRANILTCASSPSSENGKSQLGPTKYFTRPTQPTADNNARSPAVSATIRGHSNAVHGLDLPAIGMASSDHREPVFFLNMGWIYTIFFLTYPPPLNVTFMEYDWPFSRIVLQ